MGSLAASSASVGPLDDPAVAERYRRFLDAAQAPSGATERTTGGQASEGDQVAGQLRAWLDAMRLELGDDPELIKQALADLNAKHRQDVRSYFEARLEYSKQQAQAHQGRIQGIQEYGLQTLKWAFILNAGAIALVIAYVGGAVGKSPSTELHISSFAPLLRAVWPFVAGCLLVLAAGLFGFLNFSYAESSSPSAETLHGFLDPKAVAWPAARFQNVGERASDFHRRFAWKVNATRRAAIACAALSGGFFIYGVYRVLHVVLM